LPVRASVISHAAADAPRLSKPCYSVQPPMCELRAMATEELAHVLGFTVTKVHPSTGERVGSIEWLEAVDLTGVDLDADVEIVNEVIAGEEVAAGKASGRRRWFVAVYGHRGETDADSPAQGHKLNGPARITFYNVAPKSASKLPTFEASLAAKVTKLEPPGTNVTWDQHTHVLTFQVPHWSSHSNEGESVENESAFRCVQ
jgi:hypothetical protein